MKEFIEKLISRLEEKRVEITFPLYPDDSTSFVPITEAIKIVNQLAEKHNGGWIPCSERLPEGKESHKVLVTDEDGIMAVCYFLEVTKIFKVCWDGEEFQGVVAWQPLPTLYQKNETVDRT